MWCVLAVCMFPLMLLLEGRYTSRPIPCRPLECRGKPAKNSGSVSPTYLVVSIDKGSSDAVILSVETPKVVPL